MKIGVVGTFNRDRILPWQGEATDSIGGIFFTVSYLANLAAPDMEICPVANVGADFYDTITARLAEYPNVCLEGLHKVERENVLVKLVYTGPQERYEVTTDPMPALQFRDLKVVLDADLVLVNLITGSDVDLDALRAFRRASDALLYLDFHSHALGIDPEGRRYYRRPDDWREWIECVDILQMNEREARTLAGLPGDASNDALLDFGRQLVQMGPEVCHVTLAEEGSLLFYRENGAARYRKFPAMPVAEVVDIVGCGDAFAAGYVVHFLASRDVFAATEFAIEVSAMNCTFIGSSGVKEIRRLLRQRLTEA